MNIKPLGIYDFWTRVWLLWMDFYTLCAYIMYYFSPTFWSTVYFYTSSNIWQSVRDLYSVIALLILHSIIPRKLQSYIFHWKPVFVSALFKVLAAWDETY